MRALFWLLAAVTPALAQLPSPLPSPDAGQLHAALLADSQVKSNCPPLLSVTMPDSHTKNTWTVQFNGAPSAACNSAVAAVIAKF